MNSSVRGKYVGVAQEAFQYVEIQLLNLVGKDIRLGAIDEQELIEVDRWRRDPMRRALWSWRAVLRAARKQPKRVEVSFYCEGVLCGLMLARMSKRRISISVRFIEANPDPRHPLAKQFLTVALICAEMFGVAVGASQVSISKPIPELVMRYRRKGYELESADKARERKGFKPRCEILIKQLDVDL